MIYLENNFKSGFVTIIGRPNVGKSTLLNRIIGQKISIISNKPQTTRNKINAILTTEEYQIIFTDTPGIHKPQTKLGNYMVKTATDTFNDVDVILYMIDPEDKIGKGDSMILEQLRKTKAVVILVINKIDKINNEKIASVITCYNKELNFEAVVPISAFSNKNVDELIKVIVDKMPYGPKYYSEDIITDQFERSIISEIIREKALRLLEEEVPHGIAVNIEQMKQKPNGIVDINAVIYCEKDSHKGIIIGKNGQMLKMIGTQARIDIQKLLSCKVYLELWVKVKKDWRDNSSILKELGYK